ncbi:MAG: tetratricopeptide repeat protein [Saprospiraceae bacterium]
MELELSLAHCLYQIGEWQEAKFHYHRLEKYNSPEIILRLALIYEAQQNLPKAIKYNNLLKDMFPHNPEYYRKLGQLYALGNEFRQAQFSYEQALIIHPNDLRSLYGLAELLYQLQEFDTCDSLVSIGLELDATHIGFSFLLSRIQYKKRQYEETAQNLWHLSHITELPLFYNNLLGYAYIQIDSLDRAIFFLRRTLQKEAKNEYALFYLGLAFERKKDYDEALYFFQEAIKAGISDNMHLFYQGSARMYAHKGKYRSVLAAYEKSMEYKLDNEVYYFMANNIDVGYKNKRKAIMYYQKYLDGNPTDKDKRNMAKQRLSLLKQDEFMKIK